MIAPRCTACSATSDCYIRRNVLAEAHKRLSFLLTLAVGDDDDAAAELGQRCAEGAKRLAVQVVGRLVQHHHVRVLQVEHTRQSVQQPTADTMTW